MLYRKNWKKKKKEKILKSFRDFQDAIHNKGFLLENMFSLDI